jgi:hypothetical protein
MYKLCKKFIRFIYIFKKYDFFKKNSLSEMAAALYGYVTVSIYDTLG